MRAYATNSAGTGYGSAESFTTGAAPTTFSSWSYGGPYVNRGGSATSMTVAVTISQ